MATEQQLAAAQDDLRPFRMFVGALSGALAADQSIYGQDAWVLSPPGGYQSVSPYGVGLEGRPISTTAGGGLYISPAMVMLGIGVALALVWK